MGSVLQGLIMRLALFLLGAFIAPSLAKNMGGINVDGAGQMYVVGRDWVAGYVQVNGNELRLNGGGRVYFANQPRDDFSGDMWWKVPIFFFFFGGGSKIHKINTWDWDVFMYEMPK